MKKSKVEICISILFIIASLSTIIYVFGSALYVRQENFDAYNRGMEYIKEGNNDKALECFEEINNYMKFKDVAETLKESGFKVCPHCGKVIEEED